MERIRDAARCVGFWLAVVVLVCAVLSLHACGTVAGIGRDVTAWAEGGATKAANDAAAINGD